MKRTAFLFVWVASNIALAAPVMFEYKLEGYPKSAKGCHVTAQDIGDKFAQATGLVVKQARCLNDAVDGYDVLVRYESEEKLYPLSTRENTIYDNSNYKTQAACLADLGKLESTFQAETGIAPTFSYCERLNKDLKYQWLAHLDGFGKATRQPHLGGFLLFGVPVGMTMDAFYGEILDSLLARGIKVTHIIGNGRGGYADVSIHYYAEKRVRFDTVYFSKNYNQNECTSELAALKASIRGASKGTVVTFCGVNSIRTTEATTVFLGDPDLEPMLSSETYTTFQACAAARPALVEMYKNDLHLPVVAGICSREEGGYRVNMIATKL